MNTTKLTQMLALPACLLASATQSHANIWRLNSHRNTIEMIPGTEGIRPSPGIDLSGWNNAFRNLCDARLSRMDLSTADFRQSWLDGADFYESKLLDADFSNASVTGTRFHGADLSGANLTDANVTRAEFNGAVGFTAEQLYSTLSYKAQNLSEIDFGDINLDGWDFRGIDLTGATFVAAHLADADLTDSLIIGADFRETKGLTAMQLYSTKSYQDKDLSGIVLARQNLIGWDFRNQNLTNAVFLRSDLSKANLSGANLTDVEFGTALTGADLAGAIVKGASFLATGGGGLLIGPPPIPNPTVGFTAEQLYSTQSYQDKDLAGTRYSGDLSGWNFRDQDLTGADFRWGDFTATDWTEADLTNSRLSGSVLEAKLAGANLKNADLANTSDLNSSFLTSETVYNQWTRFPDGFVPDDLGLTFEGSLFGDFDANHVLDEQDYTILERRIFDQRTWWRHEMFDIDGDDEVGQGDLMAWLSDVKQALPGDADLDGSVAFSDFLILSENYGESGRWTSGDFDMNGDVEFADFLLLADGFGDSGETIPVPEPNVISVALLGLLPFCSWTRPCRC